MVVHASTAASLPSNKTNAIIVPLYKGKIARMNVKTSGDSFRLLSVFRQMFGRILIERLGEVSVNKIQENAHMECGPEFFSSAEHSEIYQYEKESLLHDLEKIIKLKILELWFVL